MWMYLISFLVIFGLFPKKILFVIRVLYVMYIYALYAIIIRGWTVQDITALWSTHSTWFIGIVFSRLEGSVPIVKGRRVMLVGNHRNFCDFVAHHVITEHTTIFLSRALVAVAYPLMALISFYKDGVWYFRRGGHTDLEKFFQWIDYKFEKHTQGRTNLLVYPEGHRNLLKKPLPLRTGMIRYAFSRKIPIQMFMCSGYDNVVNEKKIVSEWGCANVRFKVYEPIFTDQYLNFESLIEDLRVLFEKRFNELHNPETTTS